MGSLLALENKSLRAFWPQPWLDPGAQFFMKLPLCVLTLTSSMLAPLSGKIPQYTGMMEARSSRPFFYPLNSPLQSFSFSNYFQELSLLHSEWITCPFLRQSLWLEECDFLGGQPQSLESVPAK